jgi:hypothetical protein
MQKLTVDELRKQFENTPALVDQIDLRRDERGCYHPFHIQNLWMSYYYSALNNNLLKL